MLMSVSIMKDTKSYECGDLPWLNWFYEAVAFPFYEWIFSKYKLLAVSVDLSILFVDMYIFIKRWMYF